MILNQYTPEICDIWFEWIERKFESTLSLDPDQCDEAAGMSWYELAMDQP